MRPDHPPGDDIFSNAAELKRHFQSHLITQQSPRVWTSQYQPRNDATIWCLESSAAQRHHTQTKCVTTTRRIQGAPPYVASTRTFPKRQSKPQVAPSNGSWDSWMHPGDHHACSADFKALQNTTQLRGIHASRKQDKSVLRTEG